MTIYQKIRFLTMVPILSVFMILGGQARSEEKVLNIYSSRHYQTDEALYENFTKLTGIRINRLDGGEDLLIERIKNEGPNSPADILITVDAGRLWRADQLGLFAPIQSKILNDKIPANLRHPQGNWFGFSSRARIIVYNPKFVQANEVSTYQDLANPKFKGMICMRSSSNVYNLSLLGAIIAHDGEVAAEKWAQAVKENFARQPVGGDTDQIKAVAAGECSLTVANTYYYIRLLRSEKTEDRDIAQKVAVIFPNQTQQGTHVNISGAGMLRYAPHPEAALLFLEYLASESAQRYFAEGNNEYPVVAGVQVQTELRTLTPKFKIDDLNVARFAEQQPLAQRIFDRVGWR
ncbi:MAG TPA: Fe(3+) ABC transporter substrate-binding protein [Alphaproteobacteria bacterium]|nr:Fe(3+) ABC transporter substrate-binding protein [Alphaproteobacteria bacterium]